MSIKIPIRTVYDDQNDPVGLAEFQDGEYIGVAAGGTGSNTITGAKATLGVDDSNIRSLFSVSGGGSYDSSTGVITINSTDLSTYATISYVNSEISNVIGGAPELLDTLNELAAAIGDDPGFITTVTNSFNAANTGITIAQTAFDTANTGVLVGGLGYDAANTGISLAGLAFDTANVGIVISGNAFDTANTGVSVAEAAFAAANTKASVSTSIALALALG